MSDRRGKKLAGKIHVKHGFPFKSEFFEEQGDYVVLTPGNFYEKGGFKRNREKDKCYSHTFPPDYLLKRGDLLVAMTEQTEGLLGSMAWVPESNRFLHNQRLGLVTAVTNEVSLEYLYHLFKTKFVREQIRLTSTGSKVKHTSPERLYQVEVELPKPEVQLKVAKVLSTIDAKIELNNQINDELEGAAKLLYDYWFVQFDFPMAAEQAKAMGRPELEGKPYRQCGGTLIYNEVLKRDIPKDWVVSTLKDFANITMGQSPPGSSYNQDGNGMVFFQGSTDFGWRFPQVRDYTTAPSRFAAKGDILLSVRAPVGALNIADQNCCIGRGVAALNAKDGYDSFLYEVMLYFKMVFDRRNAAGTTFGAITKDDLHGLHLCRPAKNSALLDEFEVKARPFRELLVSNHCQNQALTQLRDWLLPMLMNGQAAVI